MNWYETGARLYDPQLGRFLQIDGLADIYSDWSPYVFALNNPTRYIDPTGLEPEDPEEETRKIPGCEDGSCLWNVIVRPGQDVEYYWGESNFGAHIQQYRGGNHSGPMTGGHGKVYKAAETVLQIGEYIPGVGGKVATGVKAVFYFFNGEQEQAREALWDLLPFRKYLKKLSLAKKALGVVQDAGKAAQRAAVKVAASASKGVKLTKGGKNKIGNLVDIKDVNVAEAIRSRGGHASTINQVASDYRSKTVAEIANLASQGDMKAETALKMIKQASSKAQKYGGGK